MTFLEWLVELNSVAEDRGFGPHLVDETGLDAWADDFVAGLTPAEALDADLTLADMELAA